MRSPRRTDAGRVARHLPDDLLVACIHCGFCLPTCPTHALTGKEISSPRGRIALMAAVARGDLDLSTTFREEMHFCLDCRACETACPAGVQYGRLVEGARALIEETRPSLRKRLLLGLLFGSPIRLDLTAALLRQYSNSRLRKSAAAVLRRVSPRLAELEALLPELPKRGPGLHRPSDRSRGTVRSAAAGSPTYDPASRGRVALLAGCVQRHTNPEINADTAAVLARNGFDVVVPRGQGCCGSLHGHTGDRAGARARARHNLDVFEPLEQWEAIVVNAAGCGSFLKHLEQVFDAESPAAQRAALFAAKVRDATEFLDERGWEPPRGEIAARATYHDPCHLAHGQRVYDAPRRILASIPGLELVPLLESTWCCGSAGVYNLTHPGTAERLLARKLYHVEETGADVLVTANPGCFVQLAAGLRRRGIAMELAHPLSLLARSYEGEASG